MAKRITLSDAKQIAAEEHQKALDNFLPARPGQTYVNGSYSRGPVYDYEIRGVAGEAKRNSIARAKREFPDG